AVTCAALGIEAAFTGVQNLRIKETDRLKALQSELKKTGVQTEILIQPTSPQQVEFRISNLQPRTSNPEKLHSSPFVIHTYHDHRMAMSFAPLAIMLGEIEIENPGVVKKSYPEFWDRSEEH